MKVFVLTMTETTNEQLISNRVLGVFKKLSIAMNKMIEHKADLTASGYECKTFDIGYCTMQKEDDKRYIFKIDFEIEEVFFNEQ